MYDEPEIVNDTRLFLGGHIYVRSKLPVNSRVYWECVKLRNKECTGRAITEVRNGIITVLKGPDESKHSHPPNREVEAAEKIRLKVKKQAETDKRPGSAILREHFAGVSSGVLSQLPERENLKQAMRRARKDPDEDRPASLGAFQDIPDHLKKNCHR